MQGSLAKRVRVLRAKRGLTLRDAAERVNLRPATLSDIEHGRSRPHDVTLAKIAEGYGVPVEELIEEPALAGKAEAPDTGRRSSEVADYPYPWMGDALARTIDHWAVAVRTRRDPKYSNHVAVACLDVLSSVLREDIPGDTLRKRLPEREELDQRTRVGEALLRLAERAQDHYVDSKEADDDQVQSYQERREEIRRRTREISA